MKMDNKNYVWPKLDNDVKRHVTKYFRKFGPVLHKPGHVWLNSIDSFYYFLKFNSR